MEILDFNCISRLNNTIIAELVVDNFYNNTYILIAEYNNTTLVNDWVTIGLLSSSTQNITYNLVDSSTNNIKVKLCESSTGSSSSSAGGSSSSSVSGSSSSSVSGSSSSSAGSIIAPTVIMSNSLKACSPTTGTFVGTQIYNLNNFPVYFAVETQYNIYDTFTQTTTTLAWNNDLNVTNIIIQANSSYTIVNGGNGINVFKGQIRARVWSTTNISLISDWSYDGHSCDSSSSSSSTTGSSSSALFPLSNRLWVCGSNSTGILGTGDRLSRDRITQIGSDNNWNFVSIGNYHSVAIKNQGELWTWGSMIPGLGGMPLPEGNNEYLNPVRVGNNNNWKQAFAGITSTLVLNNNGEIYGAGTLTGISPTPAYGLVRIGADRNWSSIALGNGFCAAITDNGELYTWGDNAQGSLGLGSSISSVSIPTRVGSENNWVSVSTGPYSKACFAINSLGQLWAWGSNANSNNAGASTLGNGVNGNTTPYYYTPIRIGNSDNWERISVYREYVHAFNSNGEWYQWGAATQGTLENDSKLVPTQVTPGTGWKQISAGDHHSLAIDSSGLIKVTGFDSGQFGTPPVGSIYYTPASGVSGFADKYFDGVFAGVAANALLGYSGIILPPDIPCINATLKSAEIQYTEFGGPCPGGHFCDFAKFEFYINDTLIGLADLNNGGCSPGSCDRTSGVLLIPPGVTANNNQFQFELRCDPSLVTAIAPWGRVGCHQGIAWIRLRDTNDNIVIDTCIPNDTVVIVNECGASSSSSTTGSNSSPSSNSSSSSSAVQYLLFDKASWSTEFNSPTMSSGVNSNLKTAIDSAADTWNSLFSIQPGIIPLIKNAIPSFNGIFLNDIIFASGVGYIAGCAVRQYADILTNDPQNVKYNTVSFDLYVNTDYANGIVGSLTQGDWVNVFIHELGHGVGIGTYWPTIMTSGSQNDVFLTSTRYPQTSLAYNSYIGDLFNTRSLVPIEDTGSGGTVGVHWENNNRTSSYPSGGGFNYPGLDNDLMVGSLRTIANGGGSRTLTNITKKNIIDMGYFPLFSTTITEEETAVFAIQNNLSENDIPLLCECGNVHCDESHSNMIHKYTFDSVKNMLYIRK